MNVFFSFLLVDLSFIISFGLRKLPLEFELVINCDFGIYFVIAFDDYFSFFSLSLSIGLHTARGGMLDFFVSFFFPPPLTGLLHFSFLLVG